MGSDDASARASGAAEDAPLPPYPSAVGHPLTHTVRTMPDVLGFRDRALADHDVARIRLLGPGDVYNLTHPAHLERALVDDRDAFGKSDDFRLAFGSGVVATDLLDEAASDPPASPADADNLLSTLVAVRERAGAEATMTDEELRDPLVTLIFAGHDTTASALSFALYELARHPDVRERLHAEVDRLSGPPTADDLDALSVAERVVTETLRLYPPVYVIPRETTRRVAVDGYRIPADAPVWLGVRQVQRDERFFDDPETFRPSRWDGLRESTPDFAYAPFGGGPRLCIGRGFALAEANVAFATVCRRYRLDLSPPGAAPPAEAPDPPITADMTLRLTPGTAVYLTERRLVGREGTRRREWLADERRGLERRLAVPADADGPDETVVRERAAPTGDPARPPRVPRPPAGPALPPTPSGSSRGW
ncbi:MAG: cytochrome P450 [Haloferacaceae archaeon]